MLVGGFDVLDPTRGFDCALTVARQAPLAETKNGMIDTDSHLLPFSESVSHRGRIGSLALVGLIRFRKRPQEGKYRKYSLYLVILQLHVWIVEKSLENSARYIDHMIAFEEPFVSSVTLHSSTNIIPVPRKNAINGKTCSQLEHCDQSLADLTAKWVPSCLRSPS